MVTRATERRLTGEQSRRAADRSRPTAARCPLSKPATRGSTFCAILRCAWVVPVPQHQQPTTEQSGGLCSVVIAQLTGNPNNRARSPLRWCGPRNVITMCRDRQCWQRSRPRTSQRIVIAQARAQLHEDRRMVCTCRNRHQSSSCHRRVPGRRIQGGEFHGAAA